MLNTVCPPAPSVLFKSDLGPFISDYYQDNILNPCMAKLLLEVAHERNEDLIDKMADIWVQFYTSILPTLSAIFASLQVSGCGFG